MLGIMQGRLVPPVEGRIQAFPRENWAAEFSNAAAAGLESIEWIYDSCGLGANPVETDLGIQRVQELCQEHGIAVRSLCADYFMDFPFVRATAAARAQRIAHLEWLLVRARQIGVTRLVLPFVDQSAILDDADRSAVVEAVNGALGCAQECGIELHLETALGPAAFAALLERLPHSLVKVNYDSGNSSSLGYRPAEEFAAYGERVGSVHIKDRLKGGTTVPLGQGSAAFEELFEQLQRVAYHGDFILQVARGVPGDEVAWARSNAAFVKRYLD
jgi:L-ribulose-5-phosphate 3-epimerase